jgi:hypothetical protein
VGRDRRDEPKIAPLCDRHCRMVGLCGRKCPKKAAFEIGKHTVLIKK